MSAIRRVGRRQAAVLIAAVVLLAGIVMIRANTGAEAATKTVTLNLSCATNLGVTADATSDITATATPDPAVEGQVLNLSLAPSPPALSLTVNVNKVVITNPIPNGVTVNPSDVVFSNGPTPANLVGSAAISGGNMVLTFTGNAVPSNTVVLPNINIKSTVNPGTAGSTITLAAPTSIVAEASLAGIAVTATCTPKEVVDLGSVNVIAAPTTTTTTTTTTSTTTTTQPTTTTTTSTTTTTQPTTTTTQPTTTTTRPTTTTTQATTTTTKPTTTTTRPTTTTTRPTTTTTTGGGLGGLLKWLLCFLFHIC